MPPEKTDAPGGLTQSAPPSAEEISRDLTPVVTEALEGIVEPNQIGLAAKRLSDLLTVKVRVSATMMHQGPLPPVEVAEGYERLLPGSVDRMFRMAEKDQEAYIESRRDVRERNDRYRTLALNAGIGALILILAAVILLAFYDHMEAALAVAALGVAGIIATFVNAGAGGMRKRSSKDEASEA